MCLYTKQTEPKIAEKDITCYKLLQLKVVGGETIFATPFTDRKIPMIPCIMLDKCWDSNLTYPYADNIGCVEKGMIHAFKKIGGRELLNTHWTGRFVSSFFVKCVIPEGTEYFEGLYGDICTTKLFLKEIVPDSVVRKKCNLDSNCFQVIFGLTHASIEFESYKTLKQHNLHQTKMCGLKKGEVYTVLCSNTMGDMLEKCMNNVVTLSDIQE